MEHLGFALMYGLLILAITIALFLFKDFSIEDKKMSLMDLLKVGGFIYLLSLAWLEAFYWAYKLFEMG